MVAKIPTIAAFKESICSECGICKGRDRSAEFCYTIFTVMPNEFIGRVVKIGVMLGKTCALNNEFLLSPAGFVEMICNESFCPVYNLQCEISRQKMECYINWRDGVKAHVKEKDMVSLLVAYQKEVTNSIIGKKSTIDTVWDHLPKKKKKKVNKVIKRLMKNLGKDKVKTTNGKKAVKQAPVTSAFYNSDPQWVAHLESILNV